MSTDEIEGEPCIREGTRRGSAISSVVFLMYTPEIP